jgi:hypothetical protein
MIASLKVEITVHDLTGVIVQIPTVISERQLILFEATLVRRPLPLRSIPFWGCGDVSLIRRGVGQILVLVKEGAGIIIM